MTVTPLTTLIDKDDSFEIVRDQVAAILEANQAAQVALAVTASKPDPSLWKLRVFAERANPWELFLNEIENATPDTSPIVNVWYETGSFDEAKGDPVKVQTHNLTINVDVYGWGIAKGVSGGGQSPGDESAALTTQRGVRLVRNILMAAANTYLELRPVPETDGDPRVSSRWLDSITAFQVQLGNDSAHQVHGARMQFTVQVNEFSPQADTSNILEQVSTDVYSADRPAVAVTAVTDSATVARFNFVTGPSLVVGQTVRLSGFSESTYNATGEITAAGATFLEISSIAFAGPDTGLFEIPVIETEHTIP